MKRFVIEQSASDTVTSHSGLGLVGVCLNRHSDVDRALAEAIPLRHGIAHGDIVKAYLGLLCLGKSDFEAIENFRGDEYFQAALDIRKMPSSARLRQRFDEQAQPMLEVVYDASIDFLVNAKVPVTPLSTGHVALDIDVFPMDNSKTKKEGVSRTYKGFDGYAPIAVYLGNEGWCLACELREGKQHCQKEFLYTLERAIPNARRLTEAPLLVRLDGGHDAFDTRAALADEGVDFILKWNPRQQDQTAWLETAEAEVKAERAVWETPREGKRVAIFSVDELQSRDSKAYRCRRVMRIIERTIDKRGQTLLVPELEIEGWWTSLDRAAHCDESIIALYRAHATSEQFHSEFKTDLDLERLPSGKFNTNDLIMTLAAFSYNILRWVGLIGLLGDISPVRHPAKRRRLKTVIQELMYLAARIIHTGRRLKLRFSKHCAGYRAFHATYHRLAYG
jgi:hypothetical protein